jgi:hypothetical protein
MAWGRATSSMSHLQHMGVEPPRFGRNMEIVWEIVRTAELQGNEAVRGFG